MTKFNVGDKVTVKDCNLVYEITHITRDGCYVLENDAVETEIYSWCWLKLWKPPTFSYFHPTCGLHDWYVKDTLNHIARIKSTSNPDVWVFVPVELVEFYLGDKYVR